MYIDAAFIITTTITLLVAITYDGTATTADQHCTKEQCVVTMTDEEIYDVE